MLKTRIIPCLDVADGRVVKGVNFVDLRDAGDPVDAARAYDAAGADEICFLDIHATHENRGTMFDVVTRTAEQCFIPLTVGGGVRSVADVRALLLAGADKVSFNSAAVANPDVVAEAADQFGSQCIVVAIDAKTVEPGRWEIFTHGGRKPTGIDAVAFARTMAAKGVRSCLWPPRPRSSGSCDPVTGPTPPARWSSAQSPANDRVSGAAHAAPAPASRRPWPRRSARPAPPARWRPDAG